MTDDNWQPARLIPISGLGGQDEMERRAASALLAVLGAVKEFGRSVLGSLGAPAGPVEAFCEVPLKLADGRKVRVDGVVRVARANRTWTLLVEVKTGSAELGKEQVEAYLDVAKEQGFDGLLTISNQIVGGTGEHPIRVSKVKTKRVQLSHLSWSRILSQAHMVKEHYGVSDPDQAWILGELIRYLEYEGSGALKFDDMGQNWASIRSAARHETLGLRDEGVEETAGRWDQLIQFLCLTLSARLGEQVHPVLSRKEAADPGSRIGALARDLVESGTLSGAIKIPNAVGPIYLKANLRRMIAQATVEIGAPDLKKPTARLNWLLRQIPNAPSDVRLAVAFAHKSTTMSELLGQATADPKSVLMDVSHPPRSFSLTLAQDVGSKRKAGHGGFITDVSALLDRFYRDVVQDLSEWTPPPPQLSPVDDGGSELNEEGSGGTALPADPTAASTPPEDSLPFA